MKKTDYSPTAPILSIGVFSQMLNIHQRTLRIYDKAGILCPTRTGKNRRMYSIEDYNRAKAITFMTRNLALNLSGVKIIFAILKNYKIDSNNYLSYIENLARIAEINNEIQQENTLKTARRGRPRN